MRIALLLTPLMAAFAFQANAQCHYIPSTSSSTDTVTYGFSGGSFQSYGCLPIDPTYWLSGSGNAVTITFVVPQSDPSFRVWGMNDDDMASVSVNGAAYPLNGTSASYDPKVVCGLSPGNDGVVFSGGNLVGANNNTEGNYSYQDIILQTNGVNTITITGISGLGWGFAGVTVNCVTGLDPQQSHIAERFLVSPNPLRSTAVIQWNMTVSNARIDMFDHIGKLVRSEYNVSGNNFRLDCNGLPNGIYIVRLSEGNTVIASERLVVTD